MTKRKGHWFAAGLLGAVAGAIGGLLLAPQSGKKTRQEISNLAAELSLKVKGKALETKKVVTAAFGKYSEESKIKYEKIKNSLMGKVASLKTAGEKIDKVKYGKLVDEVVVEFKDDLKSTKNAAVKIASYLKKDWEKIKKAIA